MNKELSERFRNLNESAKADLKHKLKGSPVALKLISFLETTTNPGFRNPEVVRYIYGVEEEKSKYSVLENRYFKLRKKFFDEYLMDHVDTGELLASEERELVYCRKLVMDGKKEMAYARLRELEQNCRNKNIFELLTATLDLMIFCNQSFSLAEKNNELYQRCEESIRLQSEMAKCCMLARKIYELNLKSGIKSAKRELGALKELADSNKEWPRFSMCYHHVSLYYKLSSAEYQDDKAAVSRHFASFRELISGFGNLPLVVYRPNYEVHQNFHFQQITVFYHYTNCEFREANEAYEEMWRLVMAERSLLVMYRTDAFYFNLIASRLVAEKFREAWQAVEEYAAFLTENGQKDKLLYMYVLKALVWNEAYPVIKIPDTSFLAKKISEYIRRVRKHPPHQNALGEVYMIGAKMSYLLGSPAEAEKMIRMPEAGEYLARLELKEWFEKILSESFTKSESARILKEIKDKKFACSNPTGMLHLRWLEKILVQRGS